MIDTLIDPEQWRQLLAALCNIQWGLYVIAMSILIHAITRPTPIEETEDAEDLHSDDTE